MGGGETRIALYAFVAHFKRTLALRATAYWRHPEDKYEGKSGEEPEDKPENKSVDRFRIIA